MTENVSAATSTSSATTAVAAQLPWDMAPKGSGYFSTFKLWPRANTKDDHATELALLLSGGLTVVSPNSTTSTKHNQNQNQNQNQSQSQQQQLAAVDAAADAAADAVERVTGDAGVVAELLDVDIDDTGNYIHTLAIRKKQQQQHNLVMTHGYFTGLGFFFRNYAELSRVDGWNIYSIDWLGMGRSARPTYKSGRARSEDARVANAEAFFVESLEEWRKRVGIERMTLCGHSFGGYLNAVYALKYPQHVEKLVLVSPIGIPEQPADFEEKLRQGHGPARNRHPPAAGAAAGDKTPEYEDASDASPAPDKPSRLRVAMFRGLLGLWERNYAPQDIVRAAGPFGRRLINMYVNRFSWLADEQRKGLGEYALQISTLPGSSEYALGDILRPGAFARRPLIDRLADIKMPIVFMYGENDWVDHTGGEQAIRRINGKVSTRLYRIAKAGHNLHLENSVDFNKALVKEMQSISSS